VAEEEDGSVLVDEPQRGQVLDELAIDRGLELVVEVVDAAPVREPCVTRPGGEAPVAIGGGLLGDQPGEELDVGPVDGLGLLGEGGEHARGGVQLQVAEVDFDLFVETHADTSPSSLSSIVMA